jgi:hypothetical protein
MIQAIKKDVVILPGGRIEIHSPDLIPGTHAEVVVLVEETAKVWGTMCSMIGKGKGGYESPAQADSIIRAERDSWE